MKKIIYLLIALLPACVHTKTDQENKQAKNHSESLIKGDLEKLAGNFGFTEGPAADSKGNVYFTDIPNHVTYIWTLDERLDTFRLNNGRANGLFFDKGENLLVCEGGPGQGRSAVDIYSPSGALLDSIAVPEKPANVSFGGKNRDQLYITARTSLYRIAMNTKGAAWNEE